MEYAKDEVFKIRYNAKKDKLEIGQDSFKIKFGKTMRRHKLLTTTVIAFTMFSVANVIMICNFIYELNNLGKK